MYGHIGRRDERPSAEWSRPLGRAGVWTRTDRGKGNERVAGAHLSSAPDGLDRRCLSSSRPLSPFSPSSRRRTRSPQTHPPVPAAPPPLPAQLVRHGGRGSGLGMGRRRERVSSPLSRYVHRAAAAYPSTHLFLRISSQNKRGQGQSHRTRSLRRLQPHFHISSTRPFRVFHVRKPSDRAFPP